MDNKIKHKTKNSICHWYVEDTGEFTSSTGLLLQERSDE